ncbi:MAG TPA: hypothetical protein P5293_00955 [Bacteroidales bacterium]|nr:hypothetical protein [Bacteroidales bacterium]
MIELQIDKIKGGYTAFTRTRINRYALDEIRDRGGDIQDMIPEYNKYSSISIIPDEESLDYFVELEESIIF